MIEQQNILQVGVGGNVKERSGLVDAISPGNDYGAPLRYKAMKIDFHDINSFSIFGHGLPLIMKGLFENLSSYRLIHNLSQHPFVPIFKGNAIIMSTAHELASIQFPQYNHLANQTFKGWLWHHTITTPGIACLLKSDYVLATSQLIRDGLIKADYPKSQIFMAPLGIRPEFISVPIVRLGNDNFRVGSIGTQSYQKNIEFAIEAFKYLPIGNGYTFEIWGNSSNRQAQLNNIIDWDVRVNLMGAVAETRKLDIYDSFDVFVFPSLFEGFGMPIIEAKARGLPVILWKDGKISSELREYCFLAKSPAHMAQIIQDLKKNGYNARLRKKAIASARKFTIQRMAKGILNAYEEVSKREGL